MTTVKLNADTAHALRNLEYTILFLEEQQGYPSSQRDASTAQRNPIPCHQSWSCVIDTPIAAPDIIAHFVATNEGQTIVANDILNVTQVSYWRNTRRDPTAPEPLTYANAKPF